MSQVSVCKKCQGMVVNGHDVNLHDEYTYCINCGFRPQWAGRFAEGKLTHTPIPCRKCKQYPVTSVTYPNKGVVWTDLCQYCRVEHLAKRREKKKTQREAAEV